MILFTSRLNPRVFSISPILPVINFSGVIIKITYGAISPRPKNSRLDETKKSETNHGNFFLLDPRRKSTSRRYINNFFTNKNYRL